MSFGERFGALVRRYREAHSLSAEALALRAFEDGAKRSRISELENGKVKRPHAKTIEALTSALDIPDDEVEACRRTKPDAKADLTLTERLTERSQETATQLGLQTGLLVAMARRYADEAADDFDSAHRAIEEALRLAADERARAALPSNVEDAFDAVLKTMAALNDAGDLDAAQAALDDELRAMEAEEERRKAGFARLYQRGITQARLMNKAEQAAKFAIKEAELEGALDFHGFRQLRRDWYERGRDKGVNFDLRVAIGLAHNTLQRANGSDERGKAHNDIGLVFWTLGERENRTRRLEQAVAAYEDALKEWTREADPHNWAIIKNNLGNALKTLGERESGTARLKQAVTAYEDALKEFTRGAVPLDWAMTKNNLGNALLTLGERESGTGHLEQAVAAYEDALKERTRKAVPLGWAMTKNNLGIALLILGERESGTDRLEQAVAAYEDALKERTRERVPLDWAATKSNLGTALLILGERESGTGRLEQAVAAYEDALKERTQARVPLDWAGTTYILGYTFALLGERRGERSLVVRGLGLIEDAIPVLDGGHDVWASYAKENREKARAILARMDG
ncbi:MAG: helix-turn-helix transcriptional regulator [Pseudomonadota bacterium]